MLGKESLDFSFSGLKSAVKREVDTRLSSSGILTEDDRHEIAFEFEQTVINILTKKLFQTAERFGISSVVLAGGVSANDRLRETAEAEAARR